MPEPDIYLSVIAPAYNEAARLPKTLKGFKNIFPANHLLTRLSLPLTGRAILRSIELEEEKIKLLREEFD